MKLNRYRNVLRTSSRHHLSPVLNVSNKTDSLSPVLSISSSRILKPGFDTSKRSDFSQLNLHRKTFSLLSLPSKPLVIPGKKEEEKPLRRSVSPNVSFLSASQDLKSMHLGKGIRLLKELYAPMPQRMKPAEPQEKRFDRFSSHAETVRKRDIQTPSTSETFGRKSFLYSSKDRFFRGKGRDEERENPGKTTNTDLSDFEEAAGKATRRNSKLPIISPVRSPRPVPQPAQLTLEPVLNLYTISASELTNLDSSPDLSPNGVLRMKGKKKQRLGNMRLIREVEEEGHVSKRGDNSVEILSLQSPQFQPVSLMSDYSQATATQLSNTKSFLSHNQRPSLRLNHYF